MANIFNGMQAADMRLQMDRTNPDHIVGKFAPASGSTNATEQSFRDALVGSLQDVNASQVAHEQLSVQAIVDPDSVEAHDLTIAAAQANISLSITRNIVDRVIQAYRDITNLR